MNSRIKILFFSSFFLFQGINAQLRDYIPLLSLYAGADLSSSKLKATNDLSYFSGGSTQNMFGKIGFCFFRVIDFEFGVGYDFRKIKEKIPVTCVNGFCPDQTNRYSQNVTINTGGRFRFFWLNSDSGSEIIYPYVKIMNQIEFNTSKKSKSLIQNQWYEVDNNDLNRSLAYGIFSMGGEALFENMLMLNAGITFRLGEGAWNNDYNFAGIGFEIGINVAFGDN